MNMKRTIALILAALVILSSAGCVKKDETIDLGKLKEYEIGSYKLSLPESYEFDDLQDVMAEPNCIAMLTDGNGKLPDLWVYEDPAEGATLKEFVFAHDKQWDFNRLTVYKKDGEFLAVSVFDENWYGQDLINEYYYRMEDGNKILAFDFAYEKTADEKLAHSYIEAVAAVLGF